MSDKCSFLRARRPEQKAQRRTALLLAAGELVDELGPMDVSVAAIAKRVRLSKGNLYRYFPSREAILLELLHEGWVEWVGALERELAPLAGSDDPAAVAEVLARTAAERPRTCGLVAVMTTVLEQNVTADVVLDFKLRSVGLFIRLGNALFVALPGLGVEGARGFLTSFMALLAGLWPMTNPPPVVAEVLERPELQGFQHDFEASLQQSTRALLVGLMTEGSFG